MSDSESALFYDAETSINVMEGNIHSPSSGNLSSEQHFLIPDPFISNETEAFPLSENSFQSNGFHNNEETKLKNLLETMNDEELHMRERVRLLQERHQQEEKQLLIELEATQRKREHYEMEWRQEVEARRLRNKFGYLDTMRYLVSGDSETTDVKVDEKLTSQESHTLESGKDLAVGMKAKGDTLLFRSESSVSHKNKASTVGTSESGQHVSIQEGRMLEKNELADAVQQVQKLALESMENDLDDQAECAEGFPLKSSGRWDRSYIVKSLQQKQKDLQQRQSVNHQGDIVVDTKKSGLVSKPTMSSVSLENSFSWSRDEDSCQSVFSPPFSGNHSVDEILGHKDSCGIDDVNLTNVRSPFASFATCPDESDESHTFATPINTLLPQGQEKNHPGDRILRLSRNSHSRSPYVMPQERAGLKPPPRQYITHPGTTPSTRNVSHTSNSLPLNHLPSVDSQAKRRSGTRTHSFRMNETNETEGDPQDLNPLSLHMMKRSREYASSSLSRSESSRTVRSSSHLKVSDIDENELGSDSGTKSSFGESVQRRKKRFSKMLEKTLAKVKNAAEEVLHGDKSDSDVEEVVDSRKRLRFRAARRNKGPYAFQKPKLVQDLSGSHSGAVWTMKFSHCGKLLATGGQDCLIRVWVLKDVYPYFLKMRNRCTRAPDGSGLESSTADEDFIESESSENSSSQTTSRTTGASFKRRPPTSASTVTNRPFEVDGADVHYNVRKAPFRREPLWIYRGHEAAILALDWSTGCFLLSSSMDKTVRLWHVSWAEPLCCFQHFDFVTAIAFHPKDDRYFLSGSMDSKLRLWSIPDKKVVLWNEVRPPQLITAANFSNSGQYGIVGTYDGRCVFFDMSKQLTYFTQIHVRSSRGRNAHGCKITSIVSLTGSNPEKVLITTNDSRIRLYDMKDFNLTCKYRGHTNNTSQLGASFNHDGEFIICGSEDQFVYFWHTMFDNPRLTRARRDRNMYWEAIKAHDAVLTKAVFAPCPWLFFKRKAPKQSSESPKDVTGDNSHSKNSKKSSSIFDPCGEVFVSSDLSGRIKVFKVKIPNIT